MVNLTLEKIPSLKKKLTRNQKIFAMFINRGEPPCDHENQLLENHYLRVREILKGKKDLPPYEVEIQPSSLCNLSCKYCFGKSLTDGRIDNKIGKKEMKTIIDKILEYKVDGFKTEVIKFCGTTGEPFLNPAVVDGIRLAKGAGKKVIVFTNGLLLDKGNEGKEYLHSALEADILRVSLDAGSEKVFEKIKGVRGFEKTISGLEKLIKERNEGRKNTRIIVGYVVGRDNYSDIEKAAKLLKKVGVDEIRYRVDFTNPREMKDMASLISGQIKLAKDCETSSFRVLSEYSERDILKGNLFCASGIKCFNQYFWACIGSDGNLYSCGHRTYSGVRPYGSLLEKSFKEIWTGEERMKSLNTLPDKYCKFCSPSSLRRNEFMTFLYKVSGETKNNGKSN